MSLGRSEARTICPTCRAPVRVTDDNEYEFDRQGLAERLARLGVIERAALRVVDRWERGWIGGARPVGDDEPGALRALKEALDA